MTGKRKTPASIQTTLNYSEVDETPNGNRTFPYGLVRDVKHYLNFIGLLKHVKSLKKDCKDSVRLDLILVALIVHTLHYSNSMDACAKWLEDPFVRSRIGFGRNTAVSQKTINRAVEILGRNREGILERLWKGVSDRFEIDDYDIAVDGSAVVFHGVKSRMGALGHCRDGRGGELQVEFTTAVLVKLGIPIYIKPFKGNTSDEEQYREAVPEVMALVEGKRIHELDEYKQRGLNLESLVILAKADNELMSRNKLGPDEGAGRKIVTIVADNGFASKENITRTEKLGADYLTRVKLNKSDDEIIEKGTDAFTEVPDTNVKCYERAFPSSKEEGKTNYLYFSQDLYEAALKKAENSIRKQVEIYKSMKENGIRKSQIIKIRKILGIDVDYKISLRDIDLGSMTDDRISELAKEKIGVRGGFFKLTSSVHMTPKEALLRYRSRGIVEQTIQSLKRVSGIKPLRVWGDESISGSMVLAILAEAVMAMTRYSVGKHYRHADRRSREGGRSYLPSTEMIARELGHLTLVDYEAGKRRRDVILCNWTDLVKAVFEDIRAHESPEWGLRKVPAAS